MTLKVFNIEKGLHPTSLRFLKYVKVLVLKNDYITFLMLLKFFKVVILCRECWWSAASEGRLSYHIYD